MKICPNCGSILADNEPYCENCGFDPDYDMGNWSYGGYRSSNKPYIHGEHIKSPENSDGDVLDMLAGLFLLGAIVVAVFVSLYLHHWDIVSLVMDNLGPLVLLIIIVVVVVKACTFFDG
ncbi:zinc ribbon domain-containing protein [uncultured Methanobrevibacter sp.]|uniref:zinc ribbon domain-containing protein n=1 Tax=uncultured Methanobrevibacter sp. TaxID=253161 RepID=UPI002632A3B9|nr:zinc ribbon domain-containing protein [uncultured Methanobrevibacter sp.]